MRIVGEWVLFSDGVTRPLLKAQLLDRFGNAVDVRFLVDCGADRTVLMATVIDKLQLPQQPSPPETVIKGISGQTAYVAVQTVLLLTRDDGGGAKVRGEFLGLADHGASDISVLGRDVTDNFDLILSRRRNEVLLLAPTHHYQVVRT